MMTYAPTRPIMGRDELLTHHHRAHGRDYTVACDGYEDMEAAEKRGWRSLYSWGADGWDLGDLPYVSIQIAERDGKFLLQSICEGDHDLYAFDTAEDRDAALDYLFLWYAAGKRWAPLTHEQREALDAGGFEVEPQYRGPYRTEH
jgi:hypothetical protein